MKEGPRLLVEPTRLPCLVSVTRSTSSPCTPAHVFSPATTHSSADRRPATLPMARRSLFETLFKQVVGVACGAISGGYEMRTRSLRRNLDTTTEPLCKTELSQARPAGRVCRMSWCLVIAFLLGTPIVVPCDAVVYGGSARPSYGMRSYEDSGAIRDSAAPATAYDGGAEALRRFASTRAMKTGTTIAGVVFEVRIARAQPNASLPERAQTSIISHLCAFRGTCVVQTLFLATEFP